MPSHRAIASDWGCAKSYVDRCVKRGCPTESFEAAKLWREANTDRTRMSPRRLETMPEPDPELPGDGQETVCPGRAGVGTMDRQMITS